MMLHLLRFQHSDMFEFEYTQSSPVTSFLCSNHQSLSCFTPALPCLCCDAKHIDRLWLEVGHCVLTSTGVQDIHCGCVAVGGVQVVCDLVSWRRAGDK